MVPLVDVYTAAGQQLQAWPNQLDQNGKTQLLTWDAWRTFGSEGQVQIRAHFNNGSGGWVASDPVKVTLSRSNSDVNDATAPVGPGTVDLMTGNFSVGSNDVSIDAPTTDLVASRTYLSRSANKNPNGPFGPGWRLSLPVPSAASAYEGLNAGALNGPRSGGTYTNDDSAPYAPGTAWTSPGNAAGADGSYASISQPAVTQYLKTTNFFSGSPIPTGATINGVQVDVLKFKNGDSGIAFDSSAKIVKGGTVTGTEKASSDAWSRDIPVYASYGGPNDLWGTTWSPSDINSSGFGFAISAVNYSSWQAFIDHIRVTVFYSPPGSDGSVVLSQTDGTQAHFKRNSGRDLHIGDRASETDAQQDWRRLRPRRQLRRQDDVQQCDRRRQLRAGEGGTTGNGDTNDLQVGCRRGHRPGHTGVGAAAARGVVRLTAECGLPLVDVRLCVLDDGERHRVEPVGRLRRPPEDHQPCRLRPGAGPR